MLGRWAVGGEDWAVLSGWSEGSLGLCGVVEYGGRGSENGGRGNDSVGAGAGGGGPAGGADEAR